MIGGNLKTNKKNQVNHNYLGVNTCDDCFSYFASNAPSPTLPRHGEGSTLSWLSGKAQTKRSAQRTPIKPGRSAPLSNWRGVGGEAKKNTSCS
jgi:hypothetical protein